MKQLLLDVNIVVDLCVERAGSANTRLALALAEASGASLWVYTGSVQTLEYVVASELRGKAHDNGETLTGTAARAQARALLERITAGYQWLASLSAEGPLFAEADPEDAQLYHALDRFAEGTANLLTRDCGMLARYSDRALTPETLIERQRNPRTEPAPIDFVDLKTQQDAIRPALEQQIHRVLHHGQYILGPEVGELEQRLATFTGAQHCISVASGTEALLISLMALDIGPGDEVITTPFSFIATVEVIVLLGATPIFVDIEPDTANIDASLIEAKITDQTKAILPVSLYGQPADMDSINAIAACHGHLPVIEDAAQSFGASYQGKRSGNLSTLGCTSFFPSKPLGCYGDGGAIFTNDDRLAQTCREIRVHGQSAPYQHSRIGVGGRMDTLQAAIVLAKLPRFEHEIAQRQAVAQRYHDLLGTETPGAAPLPWPKPDRTSVFAQYTLRVQDRDRLQAQLKEQGIPSAVHYPVPLNQQPAYRHRCCPDCTPVAQQLAREVMSLPMHADLSEADQHRIVTALKAEGVLPP
ncbi:DegT/DnrJ/EryC1/StrS family aminotransferase [Halochromatium glycolicum]